MKTLRNASLAALLGMGCTTDPGGGLDDVATSAAPLSLIAGNHQRWRVTGNFLNQAGIQAAIDLMATNDTDVQAMATTAAGNWIIVPPAGAFSSGVPIAVVNAVNTLQGDGQAVRAIDFNAAGGWVVVGDDDYFTGGALPAGVASTLNTYINVHGWTVRDVDITNTGYVVLGSGSLASYAGVDADLASFIADRTASGRQIQVLDIGFDGRWVAVAGQEPAGQGLSGQLRDRLAAMAEDEVHATRLMLGVGSDYIVYSHGQAAPSAGNVIEEIEYGLSGPNLWGQMNGLGLPGLSIAIVDNNQVVYSRGYGVLREGEDDHVLATTAFDTASLSKYLGALVMLRLDELGEIDLDDDILTSPGDNVEQWQVVGESNGAEDIFGIPEEIDLPAGMTVRRMMRHQAGLRAEGGSPGYPEQNWDVIDILQPLHLLLGYDCSTVSCGYNVGKQVWNDPANTIGGAPVYASGNFMLAQAVAEDATGTEGKDMLGDMFFSAMGLDDISTMLPPPAGFLDHTAWQHGDAGAVADRNIYPWVFAGGVISSARDYAEMMILALNQGRDSSGAQRISGSSASALLNGGGVGRGLGIRIEGANATEGTDVPFWHDGSHDQKARTWMCGNPTRNEGIVIMANAEYDDDGDAGTTSEIDEFVFDLLDAYVDAAGWPAGFNCR